jgi:hypothetical protein
MSISVAPAGLSVREAALQAFFEVFADLGGYPVKKRMANWLIQPSELPALVMSDGGTQPLGGDDSSSGISRVRRIVIRVVMLAGVRAETTDEIGPALSAARADLIQFYGRAMARDATLGGVVDYVRYDGDDDPQSSLEPGAPPHAVFPINFSLILSESELDPYSSL